MLVVAALAVALPWSIAGGATGSPRKAGAATVKPLAGNFSYAETSHGQDRGGATFGVTGRGTFAAKLGPGGRLLLTAAHLLTGVPWDSIARGGSYSAKYDIDAKGTYRGLVVAHFKARGLGTLCLSFVVTHGHFRAGVDHFIPAAASFVAVGGTGQAATLRGGGAVKQTNVTGSSTEQFATSGSTNATVGTARPPSAACRAVGG
jgi:hypothetical protein